MMNNPFTRMSDQQIDQYLNLHQGDPGFIIMLSQAQAAKAIHSRMNNAAAAGAPQQTVKDALMAGLPSVPNGQQMAETGIAAPNAMEESPEPVRAAGGGIIAFADRGQVGDKKAAFMAQYNSAAQYAGERLGVDPQVLLAQWGLESDWGTKTPGKFNVGNMKGATGTRAFDKAEGSNDRYVNFSDPEEFGAAYADRVARIWPEAMGSGSDAAKYADALTSGKKKYATDPNYVDKVVKTTKGLDAPAISMSDDPRIGPRVAHALASVPGVRPIGEGLADYKNRFGTSVGETKLGQGLAFAENRFNTPLERTKLGEILDPTRNPRAITRLVDAPPETQASAPNFGGPDHAQMAAALSGRGPAPMPNPDYALTSRPSPMTAPQREQAEAPAAAELSQMDQLNEIMSGLQSGDILDDSRKSLAEMKAKIGERQSKFSPMDQALMTAGFAMAGSPSRYLDIGNAGLKGLGAYTGAMAGQNASDLEMMKLQDVQTKYESALRRGDMRLAGELLNQKNQMARYKMQDEMAQKQMESTERYRTADLATKNSY